MKKRLVKALALGCVLLGTVNTVYAEGVEFDSDVKVINGSLTSEGLLFTVEGIQIGDGEDDSTSGGGDDGSVGIRFADGSEQFTSASGSGDGLDGLNCWDLNGDGECQTDPEDINGGGCDATDCQGADGSQGDPGTDGDDGSIGSQGPAGPAGTDGDDGSIGSQGPAGPAGPAGTDGVDGSIGPQGLAGLNCWDLNGNGSCDDASENTDGIGTCDALDCKGADGEPGSDGTGTNYRTFTTMFPIFDVVAQGIVSKTINCGDPDLNLKAISGGYKMIVEHALVQVVSSYPEGDGWTVEVRNYAKNMRWSFGKIFSVDMTGYAVCVPK